MAKKCKKNLGLSIDKIAGQLRENNIEPDTYFSFTSDVDSLPGRALRSRSNYIITANGRSVILGCHTKAPEIISVNARDEYDKFAPYDGLGGFKDQKKLPHVLPEEIINKAVNFLSSTDSSVDGDPCTNDFDTDYDDVDIWEIMEISRGTDLDPDSHSQKIRVIGKTLR